MVAGDQHSGTARCQRPHLPNDHDAGRVQMWSMPGRAIGTFASGVIDPERRLFEMILAAEIDDGTGR